MNKTIISCGFQCVVIDHFRPKSISKGTKLFKSAHVTDVEETIGDERRTITGKVLPETKVTSSPYGITIQVYLNVGLCIALHDITKIEDSYIFPGDGSSHTKVVFRFIVFRPFMEEILLGKIRSCSADGVHVTLGFFEDIIIPPHKLQHPSRFDQTEQAWVWEYDTGDGEKHDLFMDAGETIRFRVVSESFVETLPTGPTVAGENVEKPEAKGISPYTLGAAIDEPGLGLLTWWENT